MTNVMWENVEGVECKHQLSPSLCFLDDVKTICVVWDVLVLTLEVSGASSYFKILYFDHIRWYGMF